MFGIDSIIKMAAPIANQVIMGAIQSTPQGAAIMGALSIFQQLSNSGSSGPDAMTAGILPDAISKFIENARNMLKRFPFFGRPDMPGRIQKKGNSQSEINSILASNMSIEEKILMIASVMTDDMTKDLEKLLKKQGQQANGTGGSNSQNLENKIQVLMGRINRLQTTSSNMLQAMHTTKRALISNIRV